MTSLSIEQYGNIFEVRLMTTVPVNAWQGRVLLPADLAVQSVSYGGSIGDVWQTPPALAGTEIDFTGGATAGFTGNGILFRFTAVPGSLAGPELISFDPAQTAIYAADGHGTTLAATLQPVTVNAKDLASATSSINTGAGGPNAARILPDPFAILVVHDQAIFGGNEAILFSTTDAGSGIDHYEVEEKTQSGVIGWHAAVSPYLVDPATATIFVKAVDRAGNSRIESIVLQNPESFQKDLDRGIVIGLGILLLIGLVSAWYIRRWRKRSSH